MKERTKNGFIPEVLRGAATAYLCTLALVLIFALVLKAATISSLAVKVVNQFIKAISLFVGCFFSFSGDKGLFKGALTGVLWAAVVYATFAILGGGSFTALAVVLDFVFAAIVGGLSGIVAVNARR